MILTKPVVNRKHLLKDPSDKIERERKNTERNMKKVKTLIDIYLGTYIYMYVRLKQEKIMAMGQFLIVTA